ncbi:MAG: hypothetical protein ACKO3H_07220, partial [Verrucomicrobiota bacterium]
PVLNEDGKLEVFRTNWWFFKTNLIQSALPGISSQLQSLENSLRTPDGAMTFVLRIRHEKARILCINNLKNIGLAARIYAVDNSGRYPFQVPEREGGCLEHSGIDQDGEAIEPWYFFRVLSNELNVPKLVVCPSDPHASVALNWGVFGSKNCSYKVRLGDQVGEDQPTEVLGWCPFHTNVLTCDGAVRSLAGQEAVKAFAGRTRQSWRVQ